MARRGTVDPCRVEPSVVREGHAFGQDHSAMLQIGEEPLRSGDRAGRNNFRPGRRKRCGIHGPRQIASPFGPSHPFAGSGLPFAVTPHRMQIGPTRRGIVQLHAQRRTILQGGILQSSVGDRHGESGATRLLPGSQEIAVHEHAPAQPSAQQVLLVSRGMRQDRKARMTRGDPFHDVGFSRSARSRRSHHQDRRRPQRFSTTAPNAMQPCRKAPDEAGNRIQRLRLRQGYARMFGHGSHR